MCPLLLLALPGVLGDCVVYDLGWLPFKCNILQEDLKAEEEATLRSILEENIDVT